MKEEEREWKGREWNEMEGEELNDGKRKKKERYGK